MNITNLSLEDKIKIEKRDTKIKGLLYEPFIVDISTLTPNKHDISKLSYNDVDVFLEHFYTRKFKGGEEFSKNNQEILKEKFLEIRDKCKCIVEIGVCRNSYKHSSTSILIDNKKEETIYVGIDIDDRSFINDLNNNVYTIKQDSKNKDEVLKFLKYLGIDKIDFLFIDAWHSINAVLREWEYTEIISDFGIIGFHDTSIHPGPYYIFEAIDDNMYTKVKYFDDNINDFGISFAIKNNKNHV